MIRWLRRQRRHIAQRLAQRRIRRLPPIERGPARFRLRYGDKYPFGVGSYGMPLVHDWDEGHTLRIGAYCSIADGVQILLGGHHRDDWISTYPFPAMLPEAAAIPRYRFSRGDVTIGSDVWLCTGCIILSGVTIGHGAVVAAGAIVTRDVEPYSIVAGNPARHLRWRFDEATRRALLGCAWWSWPQEEIRAIAPLLCSNDVQGLLRYAQRRRASGD
jgi:acetyltransferase-like isoleucine patch superfamily enzyme